MRQSSFYNLIPTRAQAAFVALLYVFLCTFGMVTHTHAPGDIHGNSNGYHKNPQASVSPAPAHAKIGKRTLSTPSHCAFCDWQANSQGRTVAVWHFAAPVTFACLYARHSAPLTRVFSVRSTSRAPPAA